MALDFVMNIEPVDETRLSNRLPVHGPRTDLKTWPNTPVFEGYAAPVRIEGDIYQLEVIGTIPPELDGAYIRNSADHQFPPMFKDDLFLNGDGMLHKVRIKDGHADLSTRYVETPKYLAERKARKAVFGAYRNRFTDQPSGAGIDRSTANTSVIYHGGKLFATKEASRPYWVDPVTLDTHGAYDFDGKLQSESFTAHAKIDPRTDEMVSYGYYTTGVPDKIVEMVDELIAGHGFDHARFTTLGRRALLDQCAQTDTALGGQLSGKPWVDLDGGHRTCRRQQSQGQRPQAGTHLEHGVVSGDT